MKALAALLATVPMSGCVIPWPPGRDHADEQRRGAPIVVVCVFANCRDIIKPEKAETPTPSSDSRKGVNAPDLHASRLAPDTRRKGIGPN